MGQTSPNGLRYPEGLNDFQPHVDIKNLATDVQTALTGLPGWVSGASPAYTAPGAVTLSKPRLWAYHNIVTLNQFGQVAITTPFLNGIVTATVATGDIVSWNGIGGFYSGDNGGDGGQCRAFFRFQNAAGAWLGASNVRAHFSVVGW